MKIVYVLYALVLILNVFATYRCFKAKDRILAAYSIFTIIAWVCVGLIAHFIG